MLTDLEGWLRTLNEAAADSLQEVFEALLTVGARVAAQDAPHHESH